MAVIAVTHAPGSTTAAEDRLLDAALELIGLHGVARTTVGDVARRAGSSRATLYRCFPGGKEALLSAAATRELQRFLAVVTEQVDAAGSLEDALTVGLSGAARHLSDHQVLQRLLADEPGVVVPWLAFDRLDQIFAAASAFAAPHLARFVPAEQAPDAAEWVGRILLSYLFTPSEGVDLRDDADARRLVCTFVLPGLIATTPTAVRITQGS